MNDEVLPRVRDKVPGVELALVGSICEHVDDTIGLTKLGTVSDLRPAYASAALVVNPLRIGTGLKIKTIEALGHGKSLVTTPIGAEGLETGDGAAFLIAETATEFADAIIGLLHDRQRAETMAVCANRFAAQSNHQVLKSLQAILN